MNTGVAESSRLRAENINLRVSRSQKALIDQAKSRLDVVVDNMNPDSIVFIWWLNKNKPEDLKAVYGKGKREPEWPIWANGLFGRAMAGYYAGSGDQRILKTLETAYSGSRCWMGSAWAMSNRWPAFETYTWTGNSEIKEALTALFTKEGDDKKIRQLVMDDKDGTVSCRKDGVVYLVYPVGIVVGQKP